MFTASLEINLIYIISSLSDVRYHIDIVNIIEMTGINSVKRALKIKEENARSCRGRGYNRSNECVCGEKRFSEL